MSTFLDQINAARREVVLASEKHRQASKKFQAELQSTRFNVYEVAGNGFTRPANRSHEFEQYPMAVLGESRDIMLILEVVEEKGTEVFTALSMTDGMLWRFSLPAVTVFEPKPDILKQIRSVASEVASDDLSARS